MSASPVKAAAPKKASKPKVAPAHPKYSEMVQQAVSTLKERGGSSRQAILKYIMANFKVGEEMTKINSRVKIALRAGVASNSLKQAKGSGASGSFRIGEAAKKAPKPKKVTRPKAAKPKKAKTPKKAVKKADKPKKVKTPKKAAKTPKTDKPKKAKTPKKTAAKKPKTDKPKKAKTPKKAVKKPAAKKAAKK